MPHEKVMPPIHQAIEDAVRQWVERVGRDVLIGCIEDGRTTIRALGERFADEVWQALQYSAEDKHE